MYVGAWAELLRFTSRDWDCCRIGDRAPAIFTNKDGYLHIATQIGKYGNRVRDITIQKNRWYSLELSQYKFYDKVTQLQWCNSYHTKLLASNFSLKHWVTQVSLIFSPENNFVILIQYTIFSVLLSNQTWWKDFWHSGKQESPGVSKCESAGMFPRKFWLPLWLSLSWSYHI